MPVAGVVLGEAEAVGADYGSILQEDVVSQLAEFSDYGVGVGEEIVAYGCSAIDDHVRQQDGVISDYGVFVDYRVGADVRILADFGPVMDNRGRMDSVGIA